MTNIHDVARQAGVSISTVSLALNGSPLVKEETRRHVQQVVKELGYVPNNGARSLRQGRTHSLGVIYMSETEEDMFCADYNDDHTAGLSSMSIVNGIMQSIMGSQYGVVSEHYCARSGSLPHIIESQRVDGVFLVASPYSRPFIETLQSIGLPFVVVGVDCQAPGVDSFWAESAAGITLALRHLAETGHKNVCLVNLHGRVWLQPFPPRCFCCHGTAVWPDPVPGLGNYCPHQLWPQQLRSLPPLLGSREPARRHHCRKRLSWAGRSAVPL